MKEQFAQVLLPASATIKEALGALASGATKQIVFTVDDQKRITGCITDGDIRRGLLRGESLGSSVERVARRSFVSAKKEATDRELFRLMRKKGVRQIPILDEEGRLLQVRVLEEFINQVTSDYPVVIMAGGRGSRLKPATENIPKPLLKVNGQPIIEHLIADFQAKGVQDFYVSVNYLADQIVDCLGDGRRFGCKIRYVREDAPLGTAGSLSLLKKDLQTDFLVINGDVLSTVDLTLLTNFHKAHKAMATVCAKIFTMSVPYGVVTKKDSDVVGIEEKPDVSFIVNAGIYFFSKEMLGLLAPEERIDMPALLSRMIAAGESVKCFQSTEPWLDIGSQGDFEKAQKYWDCLIR